MVFLYKAVAYADALRLIRKEAKVELAVERKRPIEAMGQVLASEVVIPNNAPPHPIVAFDGYAVRSEDTPGTLVVIDKDSCYSEAMLERGYAIRVNTGDPLPKGCNAVAPLESVIIVDENHVKVPRIPRGLNVDEPGAYGVKGEVIASRNCPLRYSTAVIFDYMGLMVDVYEKPRVILMSIHEGYDVTGLLLAKLISHYATWVDYKYTRIATELSYNKLSSYLRGYHAGIIVGGAGPSKDDLLEQLVEKGIVNVVFRGVDIKGGRPSSLIKLDDNPVLWISGPPATISSTFFLLALPFLQSLGRCEEQCSIGCLKAKLMSEYSHDKPTGLYVKLIYKEDGVEAYSISSDKQRILNYLLVPRSHGVAVITRRTNAGSFVPVYLLP